MKTSSRKEDKVILAKNGQMGIKLVSLRINDSVFQRKHLGDVLLKTKIFSKIIELNGIDTTLEMNVVDQSLSADKISDKIIAEVIKNV